VELDRIKGGAEVNEAFVAGTGPWFAIWLQCELFPEFWHLGAAFREIGEAAVTRIDQTDEGLRCARGVEPGERWWVFLPTDRPTRARVRLAIQRLRRAAEVSPPYGRLYVGGVIDDTGRYQPAPGEVGLSCASLILAVFEGVAWPLVDRSTWAGRTLPAAIAEAAERELTEQERERFANDHGLLVLPSEVAGACLFELPRVPLSDARRGAEHFEEQARRRANTGAS